MYTLPEFDATLLSSRRGNKGIKSPSKKIYVVEYPVIRNATFLH